MEHAIPQERPPPQIIDQSTFGLPPFGTHPQSFMIGPWSYAHPPNAHPPTAHPPIAHPPNAHPPNAHPPNAHLPIAHPPIAHPSIAHPPNASLSSSLPNGDRSTHARIHPRRRRRTSSMARNRQTRAINPILQPPDRLPSYLYSHGGQGLISDVKIQLIVACGARERTLQNLMPLFVLKIPMEISVPLEHANESPHAALRRFMQDRAAMISFLSNVEVFYEP